MPIFDHNDLAIREVPRIRTRVLAGRDSESGAEATAVWEQWMGPGGHIPLHYHTVEEVLVILWGRVRMTLDDRTSQVQGPATIVVPPRQLHALEPMGDEEVHLLAIFPTATPDLLAPDGSPRPMPWEDTPQT